VKADAEKLRLLADWFDAYDKTHPTRPNEVQIDLREIAIGIEADDILFDMHKKKMAFANDQASHERILAGKLHKVIKTVSGSTSVGGYCGGCGKWVRRWHASKGTSSYDLMLHKKGCLLLAGMSIFKEARKPPAPRNHSELHHDE
jgi:hypothetical protein